jgi:hypothetical protein
MRKMIFVAALVIGSAATASAGQPSGHGGGSYGGGSYVGGYGNYSNPHSTGNSYTAHADSHDGGSTSIRPTGQPRWGQHPFTRSPSLRQL